MSLPPLAWLGIGLGAVLAIALVVVALRIRQRIQAIRQIARAFEAEKPGDRKAGKIPEVEPAAAPVPEKPPPVLAPGEKLVFEEKQPAGARSLAQGLERTREGLVGRIRSLVSNRSADAERVDELEEILFTSDLGVKTATELLSALREKVSRREAGNLEALTAILKDGIRARLGDKPPSSTFGAPGKKPWVVMVVGVNGVGKTTTIGKLARQIADGRLGAAGRKVVIGAGDTFRAAAAEQLEIWGERAGAEVISNKEGTDPSAVAFDAAKAAVARGADVLIVDTAGRLHTKANLMEELKKVKRILGREIDGAPHEVLLVVDATTGQNALNQAKEFNAGVGVTGIVLTKLDGTAKGGIVVGIRDELKIPVLFIGVGEGVEDLRAFDPDAFVEALFS